MLRSLGALDTEMMLTAKGRRMQELSLPPRLAAMVLAAPAPALEEACLLATVIGRKGLGGTSLDLDDRLQRARRDGGDRAEKARGLARRMAATFVRHPDGARKRTAVGAVRFFHAFPDRIALQRRGRGRFVMANGRGAEIDAAERLSGAEMLVIADLTGRAGASAFCRRPKCRAVSWKRILHQQSRPMTSWISTWRAAACVGVVSGGSEPSCSTRRPSHDRRGRRRRGAGLGRAPDRLAALPFSREVGSCATGSPFFIAPSRNCGRMYRMPPAGRAGTVARAVPARHDEPRRYWRRHATLRQALVSRVLARGGARTGAAGADAFRCADGAAASDPL